LFNKMRNAPQPTERPLYEGNLRLDSRSEFSEWVNTHMAQRLVNVRVRPARVVVLINKDAGQKELLLALEFFSRIWGGRFGQLLAVDANSCDALTAFRLGQSRPEFVYGIGLDDEHWRKAISQACQPRGYGKLQPDFVRNIKRSYPDEHYPVDYPLIHLFQTRDQKGRKQTLRLVSTDESSAMAAYCAATFGIHQPNLRKEFFDESVTFSENTAESFIDLATEFVKEWKQSWLDVTGHELNPRHLGSAPLAPTVVLIQSPVQDVALFWNLRTASDTTHPAWIIPIPVEGAVEPGVLEKLKQWLVAFLPYRVRFSYCQVTSQTVAEEKCRSFAREFQRVLGGSPIEAVDYEPPRNQIPLVIPFEYETTWAVDVRGRKLTLVPPKPRAFEHLGSPRTWFVDLLKDVKTGRAIKEMQLPPSSVVLELLNGPCPPHFEHSILPRTGDGPESINLCCSGSREVINVYIPTSEEVLGEILREHGVEPVVDEKRSSYLPVIKRFGGLWLAASAFSGQSGAILNCLADHTKTLPEIRGACQLGGGSISGESYTQRIEETFFRESDRMKRVSRRRFLDYARRSTPENLQLTSVLEHWADRKIISRNWKIGPCQACGHKYFVPYLDIQKRVVCTTCGRRISLPARVEIGYTLQRAVRHAIQEGIMPIALTGRFLRGMTNQGFFWLPGVKYKVSDTAGDIDVLACCDGTLVLAECKRLAQTPKDAAVWNDVAAQFLDTARIAKLCGAGLVVLAAQVDEYPGSITDQIRSELGDSIPHLLLDKKDLETGYRHVGEGDLRRPLGLYDLIRKPFPERPREATDKPRTINFGWGVLTS
jgi:hypothetical protein